MRSTISRSILASALAGAVVLPSAAASAEPNLLGPSTIAVYGDAPYGTTPTDTAELAATPAFIDSINADPNVSLVMHVGDIHSGKQYCTRAYDQTVYDLWTRFQDPLVYTPGDNEWSDCHKKAEGGGAYNASTGQIDYVLDEAGAPVNYASGDPIANLDLIRSIFFAKPGRTLGGKKLVISQRFLFDPNHRSDSKYVENVLWEQSQVVFATVNLPGGSNNDQDVWYGAPAETPAQAQERSERSGADLRWLDYAFFAAKVVHAKGVVIMLQADMWDPEKGAEHQAGYDAFVSSLASHTLAFGGPVLLLNGDSHEYLSDNPFSATEPSNLMHPAYHDVPNFRRVVVHGSTFPLEWLRLKVNPRVNAPASANAIGPFSWERVTQ